jgi:integrase/recombinase XerD
MTTNAQHEEERICRPLNRWPARDRQHWQAALTAGDLLEQGGCRAEHSPVSNRKMMRGYGRWLTWLDSRSLLDEQVAPGERITRERVRAYASDLEEKNASVTVMNRLVELKVVAAIMDPGRDWSWIYQVAASIRARHKPARPKRHRLVPVQRLLQLGLDLMAKAENETTTRRRFRVFRDG